MEESNSKLEELPVEPRQGSGSLLAAARKQQQKTIEEIAEELNLSVTQIKTIELDQTDGLPEPTYVRGYIRSYAKLLGLKPEEVLHNYLNPDWQKTSSLNDIPRGIGTAEEATVSFFSPARLFMLLLIAVIVIALWAYGLLDGLLGTSSTPEPAEPSDAIVQQSESQPVSVAAENGLAPSNQQIVAQEDITTNDALTAGDTNAEADNLTEGQVVQPAATGENQLIMTFNDTSWVDIRNGNDERKAYKSFAEGERLEITEADELRVFIGNADGVSVELNGSDFDLAEHREGVYAKFVIAAVE